jgi:hypothetical protein
MLSSFSRSGKEGAVFGLWGDRTFRDDGSDRFALLDTAAAAPNMSTEVGSLARSPPI